jgi:hypothetical protein
VQKKADCLKALETNPDMQDRAIRSELEVQKPGEKTILLPPEGKASASPCDEN